MGQWLTGVFIARLLHRSVSSLPEPTESRCIAKASNPNVVTMASFSGIKILDNCHQLCQSDEYLEASATTQTDRRGVAWPPLAGPGRAPHSQRDRAKTDRLPLSSEAVAGKFHLNVIIIFNEVHREN